MKDFLKRLTSRKFLLTIAGLIGVTLKPDQADSIIMLIGFFVGAEGAADVVERYSTTKYVEPAKQTVKDMKSFFDEDDEDIDRSTVIPGN